MSEIPDLSNLKERINVLSNRELDFLFRKYLEILGFKWSEGQKPTEISCFKYNNIYYILQPDKIIRSTSTDYYSVYNINHFIKLDRSNIKKLIENL